MQKEILNVSVPKGSRYEDVLKEIQATDEQRYYETENAAAIAEESEVLVTAVISGGKYSAAEMKKVKEKLSDLKAINLTGKTSLLTLVMHIEALGLKRERDSKKMLNIVIGLLELIEKEERKHSSTANSPAADAEINAELKKYKKQSDYCNSELKTIVTAFNLLKETYPDDYKKYRNVFSEKLITDI
jgi:hypothetical protein